MSITFYKAFQADDDGGYRYESCDCDIKWNDAFDRGDVELLGGFMCDICRSQLNLSNANARDLLQWLDLAPKEHGVISASELAARCKRRLWDEARNHDPALEGYEQSEPGQAKLIVAGRRPDYLRENTERLLKLAERADSHFVMWG